ncbi:MAG: regulatory protein RecX [Lachnospiraceae bacterium]
MRAKKSAREYSLSMLERFDRTEHEVRSKLREKEYEPEEIEEAVSFLKEYRFIDDAEYARKYIRVYSSKKSIRKMRFDLERKGINKEVTSEALEEYPVDEEEQVFRLMQKKGYQPGEYMEPAAYQKLAGALARKGYSYQVIRRAMSRAPQEDWLH